MSGFTVPGMAACLPVHRIFGRRAVAAFLLVLLMTGFAAAVDAAAPEDGDSGIASTGPARVSIERREGAWQLLVNDEIYDVHGVGLGDVGVAWGRGGAEAGVAALAARGGNTFRTWETDGLQAKLDAAAREQVKVLVGLDVQKQLQGFDYGDPSAVREQYLRVTEQVERYRQHPAVLGWILANEPNLMLDHDGQAVAADPRVYDALADILDYIHDHDPQHPATVSFAFTARVADDISAALARMPTLDFISLQAYGALPAIPELVRSLPDERPYMITEYGPLGHWEMPATEWGREIEEPSGLKARGMLERMDPVITADPTGRLIGSFAFLWGQKQERTPTWYGLFTANGERTASVDELQRLWTGCYPPNRAPSAWSITLDGRTAFDSVRLDPDGQATVRVEVDDPENDALSVRWELMHEVSERSDGGHFEATPATLPLRTDSLRWATGTVETTLDVPRAAGEYRLYAYVSDDSGGVATANIPFLVP